MTKKKTPEYKYIKKRRSSSSGVMAVLIVALLVIVTGCAVTIFALNYTAEKIPESAGVSLNVGSSGNDLVVEIIGGARVSELNSIYVIIEKSKMPEGLTKKEIKAGERKIYYPSILYGIKNSCKVCVRGIFSNGDDLPLKITEIRLS